MRLAIVWIALLPAMLYAQNGKFADGYKAQDSGVTIEIVQVHSSPRCKHEGNCFTLRNGSKVVAKAHFR